jgi:hypothetical protein
MHDISVRMACFFHAGLAHGRHADGNTRSMEQILVKERNPGIIALIVR